MMAKGTGALLGQPIHGHLAARRLTGSIAEAVGGAELHGAGGGLQLSGDRPACITLPHQLVERGPAQAPPGGKKGDSFEQVGFARPVGAGEHHRASPGIEPKLRVIAEAREGDAVDGERGGHTRMGIST